jgi:uncharacterized protein YjbJ (UPF0337 family)
MNDYQQPESSDAIKADIEQTRAEMGAKIDRLQQKLDPSRLKEQAQETVRDFVSESRAAMMDYVRENRQELTSSMMNAIKQNPVPTALIGLGLGWLIVESVTPARRERYPYDAERNRYLPVREEDAPHFQSTYRTGYNTGYRSGQRWSDYDRTPTYGEWQGSSGISAQDYRASQGYPGSQSYMGSQAYQSGEVGQSYSGYQGQGYQGQRYGQTGQSSSSQGDSGQYGAGEQYRSSQRFAAYEGREDDGQRWTEEAKQRAQDAAQTVGEKAGDAVENVREAASNVGQRVSEFGQRIGDRVSELGERAGDMRYQARDRASQISHQVSDRSYEMSRQARQMGRQVGRQFEYRMEENPLLMGAFAFVAGAAVAMLLPQSRVENRMIGPARDQMMGQVKETAQELADDVVQRAERVAEEVRPELEQTVRKVVEDVKQTGKEAAQDLQDTAHRAQEKAKAEGGQVKAKVKDAAAQVSHQTGSGTSSSGGTSSSATMSAMPGSAPASTQSTQSSGSMGSQTGSVVGVTPSSSQGKSSNLPANWDTVKGQWHQWKGEAKRQWGKLTDDDLTRIEGDYEKLVGLLQKQYGYSRSRAEQEIGSFSRTGLSSRSS